MEDFQQKGEARPLGNKQRYEMEEFFMSKILVVDPGHGGTDPGAQGQNVWEEVCTLITAKRVKQYLINKYDVQIIMTRSDNETSVDLATRPQIAIDNNANAFISFHYNVFDGTAYGFQSMRQLNDPVGSINQVFQDTVHKSVTSYCVPLGLHDRGEQTQDLEVLRNLQGTNIAAIMLEGLFIDNTGDIEKFMDADYLDAYVEGVSEGIASYLQLPLLNNEQTTVSTIDFVGKVKGDGDISRTIKYSGIYQALTVPNNVVTEVNGGYAGVANANDSSTMLYEINNVGNKVQFDFIFNLNNIGARTDLLSKLRNITFNEKVANGSTVARNAEQEVYVWNVTQQAWTNEVLKTDDTVGNYLQLSLINSFTDVIDANNNIIFCVISHQAADTNPVRVEIDHAYLTVEHAI